MGFGVWRLAWCKVISPLVLATCDKERLLLVTVVYSNSSTSRYVQVLRLKIQDSYKLFIHRDQLETSKQTFPSKTRLSWQNCIVQC